MIQSINKGKGFRGASNYVLEKEGANRLDCGTMAGRDARELAREAAEFRKMNPKLGKAVFHVSLSLSDGETLPEDTWANAADHYMKKMGFDNSPWYAVRHSDADHDHIHIVALRIDRTGQTVTDSQDYKRGAEIVQEIETHLGLKAGAMTPEQAREKDAKSLSRGEVQRSLETGEPPNRAVIRGVIDSALSDNSTVDVFVSRLDSAGVSVRPNIATTGHVSGVSFEMDGIAFKGSQLGKGYSWSGLQKHGLDYDQARDVDILKELKYGQQNGAGAESRRKTSAESERDPRTESRDSKTSGLDSRADRAGADVERATGRDTERAAIVIRPAHDRIGAKNDIEFGGDGADADRPGQIHGFGGGLDETADGRDGESSKRRKASEDRLAHGSQENRVGDKRQMVCENDAGGDRGDSVGRASGSSAVVPWNARFKRISAARKRNNYTSPAKSNVENDVSEQPTKNKGVDQAVLHDARELSPAPYFEAQGYKVRQEGRHLSVQLNGDECYRSTLKPDGHWVHCDHYGGGIGDNIALVQHIEPGKRFAEAVFSLLGSPSVSPKFTPATTVSRPRLPTVPNQGTEAMIHGRDYLRDRGISQQTISMAEKCGFLRYCDDGVIFTGRDQIGVIRSATKRATNPGAEIQKRDLAGTDKRYPAILDGQSNTVWVVEGGVDALAAQDMAIRRGKEAPTVLVSGGANVRGFLDTPHIQKHLKSADKVIVCYENESTPEKQVKTDAGHDKQIEYMKEITNKDVGAYRPDHGKDMADMNRYEQQQIERETKRQSKREERDHGLSF